MLSASVRRCHGQYLGPGGGGKGDEPRGEWRRHPIRDLSRLRNLQGRETEKAVRHDLMIVITQ